jgi:hypothetical protein
MRTQCGAPQVEDIEAQLHTTLLRWAIPIPGALHILHNVTREMNTSLQYFDTFWDHLKVVNALLRDRPRRERFVAQCVVGSPFEQDSHDMGKCHIIGLGGLHC